VRSDHSVNAIPGLVYENTGPYRFADGNVGRILRIRTSPVCRRHGRLGFLPGRRERRT
jgi:hypothetical protein